MAGRRQFATHPPGISGYLDDAPQVGRSTLDSGRASHPTQPKPGKDWLYLQMVKQRDQHGHLEGIQLKAVWGSLEELLDLLGKCTAYIERSHLTARMFNARLTRKTLAFSKNIELHEAAVTWEDA
jgi:hypothetical protein